MKPNSLLILAILLSIMFWLADSIVDVVIFAESDSILENIINPGPVEMWMRLLMTAIIILFSFYAKYLLTKQIKATDELNRYKYDLEKIVESRTSALKEEIEIRKRAEFELEIIATTDSLTLLYNRRKFNEMLSFEIKRECRYRNGLNLVLCDIDKFKDINDKYGHVAGDEVLKLFSVVLKNSVRKTDIVARWGGEEFAMLVTNTDIELASKIANKIREIVENKKFGEAGRVTASFGIACYEGNDSEESLVKRADKALYLAKTKGRNRVEVDSRRA